MDPKEVIALYPPSISGALHKPVQRPKILKPSDEIVDDEINNDQKEKASEDEIETEDLEILGIHLKDFFLEIFLFRYFNYLNYTFRREAVGRSGSNINKIFD